MNIYIYEMRSQLRTFVIWTVSILLVLLLFMWGLYQTFMTSVDDVQKAFSGFPPAFALAFGIVITELFTYGGFFQFIYPFLAVVGAIMAASIGLGTFSREKRSKCVDFLMTKPVSRGRIFMAKLLSSLSLLAAANILFVAANVAAYAGNGQDAAGLGRLVWAYCAMFFMQLVFFSFGVLFAAYARRVRSVSGIATAFGFAGFILTALRNLLDEEALRFVAPLTYFQPYAVFKDGGFETKYAITAAVVTVACLGLSYWKYTRYDVPAL